MSWLPGCFVKPGGAVADALCHGPLMGWRGRDVNPVVGVGRIRSQHTHRASSHFLCRDAEAVSVWHT